MTIVQLTLREAVSRRLLLAVVILSGVFVALVALGFALAQGVVAAEVSAGGLEDDAGASILTLLALYVASFLAAFLALFLSAGSVSSEVDSGQLHAVLARPLPRWSWLLQRWLGLGLVVVLYVALLGGSLLLVARVTIGYQASRPLVGLALMALQALTLLTLGLLGSTRLPTLANGAVVFFAFGLAWMSGLIEFVGGVIGNPGMERVGVVTSLLIPSDALWRGASAALSSPTFLAYTEFLATDDIGGFPFTGTALPSPALLTWSLLYVPALLLLAVRTFARRDL